MKMALSIKNKLGFIDGPIEKPDGSNLNLLNAWQRNNNIVISWILNCCTKEIASSIVISDSAMDIWKDLQERYEQSNGPRIFELRQEIMNLVQDQKTVGVLHETQDSLGRTERL